jgi:hypothetical protein
MKNVSDYSCTDAQNTHSVFSSFSNRAICETWKNVVGSGRTQKTIYSIQIACWIPKAIDTHSEYVKTFSTETTDMRTRFNVPLYVNCLPFVMPAMIRQMHIHTLNLLQNELSIFISLQSRGRCSVSMPATTNVKLHITYYVVNKTMESV